MKKFRKIASISLVAAALLVSCGKQTALVALITDLGDIDDKSFNQGSWEGVLDYNKEHAVGHQYYKPAEGTNAAYIEAIDLAVSNGAEIVITPGFLFEQPVAIAQKQYPDVHFVLLDAEPFDTTRGDEGEYYVASNTVAVMYAEEQSGYLAGYGVVMDGHTKLGFMGGMSVPAVRRFGLGFLVGAHDAAVAKGLDDKAVTVKYHYTGGFTATPEAKAKAETWYAEGVSVIFACGGSVGQSVMAAAEAKNGLVVGVDVDQAGDSETVITSAMKGLSASVQLALGNHFDDKWEGGVTWNLDASQGGVGLPTAKTSWRFNTWKVSEYETILGKLAAKTVTVLDKLPADYLSADEQKAISDLGGATGTLAKISAAYEG